MRAFFLSIRRIHNQPAPLNCLMLMQVAVSIRDKEDNAVKFSKKKGIVLHKGR